MAELQPSHSTSQPRGGRKRNGAERGGVGAQELCPPGPEDPFWEHGLTLHGILVIRAGQRGQLEHSGELRLQPLTENRHTPPVPLRPKAGAAVERFASSSRGVRRVRVGQSSLRKRRDRWMVIPQPSLSPVDQTLLRDPNAPSPSLAAQP